MEVISTNLSNPTTIIWNQKEELTGMYKIPTFEGITLKKEYVISDYVEDLCNHGGIDKACYIFSSDHYSHWKNLYPSLIWNWGMFGENITVSGLDESTIFIGDIYKIGTSVIQVSQPRQPCYKLGIRFENQLILKQFIQFGFPGIYVRILEEGSVKAGDKLELIQRYDESITICEAFQLIYSGSKPELKSLLIKTIHNPHIAASFKRQIERFI